MNNDKVIKKNKEVLKVSVIGMIFNVFLLGIKLFIGFFSKSQAMIADGINSAGDIFASLMSYIGAKISSKPKDDNHPFGHGKAEYVFALLISISMVIASFVMIQNSINSIISKNEVVFSNWLVIICLVTIITKLILYIYCKCKSKKYNSILILASKEDHRNDILLTFGTLIGVTASKFGLTYFDGIFGIITSLWITFVGFKLFTNAYKVLIDTSIDKKDEIDIINQISKFDEILHVDSVKSKPAGEKHVIIIKISMDENYTLKDSHTIAGKLKEHLISKFEYVLDVIVHINPHKI